MAIFSNSPAPKSKTRDRFIAEAKRLLAVVDTQLDGKDWITGRYSIADIALAPWLNALDFYGAKDVVGWSDYQNAVAYVDRFFARDAAQRGRNIPPREG